MNVLRREFKQSDFEKVRDFLKETYSEGSSNWYIDRWNFCRYFAQNWLEIFDTWPSTVGMWVDKSDEIVAIVSSEGEKNGEVFFQLREVDYSEDLINILIDYAEENLSILKDECLHLYPRINNICKDTLTKVLVNRGYSNTGDYETDCSMDIKKQFNVDLPDGFMIQPANNYSAPARAQAHGRAFTNDLSETSDRLKERTRGYMGLVNAPDYNEYIDLCIVDDIGEIASFTTLWFDSTNLIGILEPVGTILKYRRRGLGKAVIYEGIKRIKELGATKVHVGSNQDFYKAIGFQVESRTEIWHKVLR